MGKIPLKSNSFMKNHYMYLLTAVFYENQYLSVGKEKLNFSCRKLMTSKILSHMLLSLPLNMQKSNPNYAFA